MKTLRTVGLVAGLLQGVLLSTGFSCGLNWSLPVNHFENVNPQGKLSYWQKLGEIEVGDDFKFPIHLNFRADRYVESAGLGVTGFMLGITDSSIVALDERRFLVQTPAGRYRTFRRDRENPNILRSSSKWAGEIKGDTITVASDCGDKLIFRQGAITRMQVKERTFDFIRNGNRVTEIREGGRTLASIRENGLTGAVELVQRNGQIITFEFGKRPLLQSIAGSPTPVIGGFAPTVSKIVQPDGKETNFAFGTNKELLPTMEIGTGEQDQPRTLAWNPVSGQMLKDGNWTYDIKAAENPRHNATIARANADGVKEFWSNNRRDGVETIQNQDKTVINTQYFTSGKLSGLIRRQAISRLNEPERIISYIYDESANLVAKVGPYNQRFILIQDDQGQGSMHPKRFALASKEAKNRPEIDKVEQILEQRLNSAKSESSRQQATYDLAKHHLFITQDYESAMRLKSTLTGGWKDAFLLHFAQNAIGITDSERIEFLSQITDDPDRTAIASALIKNFNR